MARTKEQKDQLKSLVDQLRSEGVSTDEIQARVDEQKAKFDAEQTTTVEVTDEIQEPVTEGKTNGAVAKGATATPVTGQAPESTESDSVDTSGELQQIDNSPEAILKRRKLNALEEAAIMQQDIELDEVVVTAEAPKPFSYWKDLVLSPEYEEAFSQIQKDTGEFSSTKDQGILEYIKQFGKAIYAPASKKEDSTYDPINLDLFTRIEIAKKLDKKTLQKAQGGFLNLKEKEKLISDAKAKVVERSLYTLENDLDKAVEQYDTQYEPIKSEAKAIQDRINSTFNFENGKPIIATQPSADLYNNLIGKYNNLKTEVNDLNKGRESLIQNYETDINLLQTEYGIDLATGVMDNNFQLTSDVEEYNKKIQENTGADITSRVAGGLWKFAKGASLAIPQLAAYTADLFTDEDSYSVFDAWADTTSNLTNYNTLGEPEAAAILDEDGRYVKDPKQYLRMTADMVPFTLGIIGSTKKGDLKGAQKLLGNLLSGKKGRMFGISDKLKQNITMGNAAFKMTVNDNIREGRELGLNDAQSLAYGSTKALGTAISQAVMPDANFLKSGAGKGLLNNFASNLKNAANKKGFTAATKTFTTNLAKELNEEEIELALDMANKLAFGISLSDTNDFIAEQKQLVAGTLMLSGGLGSIGAVNTFNAVKKQTYDGIIKNQNLLLDQIQMQKNMAVQSGDLEMAEQLNNAEKFTRNIVRAAAVSPENVTADQLDLVVEKQKLLEKRKKLDPSFRNEIDQEIDVIDDKIANSRVQKGRAETERKIEVGVAKLAEELGIESETVKDDDAKLNRLQELRKEGYAVDEKDSTNYGTFLTNKDGDIKLIFNEAANTEDNVITTKAHEMLHAVVLKTVANNPGVAEQLGTSLLEALKTINAEQTTGEYQRRLKSYLKNPELSADESFEEGLTLLSEAMINGDIVYKESIAQKIGRGLEKLFGISGTRAVFNDGKDVFNFIRDYNDSLIKGKVNKGIVATAKEGALGKLTQVDTTTESQAQPKTAASTRIYQEVESQKEDLINPETKAGTALIIANDLENEVDRRLNLNIPAEDKADIVRDFIADDTRGLTGLLLKYDEDRNDSIMGYLNSSTPGGKLLDARLIEFYQDDPRYENIIQSTTDEAVQRKVESITTEETSTPEAEVTTEKLIDSRTFGPATDVSIDNIVTIKEGEKPSFRELAEQNLDEVSTKVFNVPGKKIRGRATLTDGEAKSLQRLFVDPNNVRKLIKTMPPYNVAGSETVINEQGETIDVSREFKGKSIGLSTKFINKYYQPVTRAIPGISNAKGRSLGSTTQTQVYELKPEYTGRISNEVVKQIQDDVGVTEAGVPNQKISAENRSKYGTTLTGFSKAYLANAINAAGRGKQTTKQEQANTGAGKAKRAASERSNRFEVSGKNGIVIMRDNAEQFAKTNKINIEFEGETINVRNLDSNNPKHRAYVQQAVENELWKYFPIEAIDGSTVVDYSSKQDRGFFFTKEEWNDISNKAKDNKTKWLARGNELNYDVKAIKVAKAVKAPPKRKDYYSSGAFNNKLELWEAGVEAILDGGANAIKANKDLYLPIFAVFSTQSQSSSHLVRNMSVEKGASEAFINATKGTKTVKEHVEPSNEMAPLMYEAMLFDEVNVLMPVIKKVYYQLGITKLQDDKTLDPSGIYGDPYNYKTTQINEFNEGLREYFKTGDVSKILSPLIRYFNPQVNNNTSGDGIPGFNSNELILEGKTVAEIYTRQLTKTEQTSENLFEQNQLTYSVLNGSITQKEAVERLDETVKLKSIRKASIRNNNENNTIKFSEQVPNQEILDNLGNADQAMANARNPEAPVKKIRVFDFDDTLAQSNSQVLYEMPDGTTGKLNATQFATRAGELEEQGAEFDFSEFSKVVDGKKGPVFKAIENIVKARGAEDVFILTARPADAAGPIKEFMEALGVNLPIENIVGLGDGKAEAKARWMTGKAAEGYNDFFFVDDAYKNVKAVQDALNVFDVKSKTQQAFRKASTRDNLDKGFNDILENKTGIASEKEYGRVKAEVAGAGKGRLNFFIPPSAEDFVGLLYATLGKGKLGDQQMAWYKTHLLNPYARAMNELSSARIAMFNDYKQLKKQLEIVPKDLRKKVPGEPFTREQAVRVYIWNKQGMDIPGISKKDQADLSKYVSDNAELQVFADRLIAIQKGDQYAGPKEGWPAGTITTDMLEGLNTTKRAKYLDQWQQNADVIFSEKNLNKLEAAYGKPYRLAMENMLQRMKSGRNRNFQGDTLTGRFTDWVTGSIGTIMFFNTRSALLQTISSINFVNFTDNNVLAAGKAFANQKQYWSDFMTLMNSDFLKERRGGLRINVSEADIADMAKKGGAKGVINKLLEFGFTPTQIADSFAIASGGATFYRNRIKSLKKQGMTDAEAEAQAFVDFRETAEESQQSSRPDRISMQQAGPLGRLVLAFANTPAQYARLIKKAASDLKNGRGDAKTNISKIIYYGVAQNLLFNALQQALFAFAFDDDEEDTDEQQKKYVSIANGMMDSLLRGMGLGGAVLSVGKNSIIRIINEMEKKQPKLEKVGYEITKLSPPISAKLSRINQAARSYQWDKKDMMEKGWSLDNPAYLAGANVVAALTNVPLDRAIKKTNNVVQATSQDLETWERLALLGGWQDWEIGIDEEKPSNKPQPRKTKSRTKKRKTVTR